MKPCPTCGAQNADDAALCSNCAEHLATAVYCENCGAANPPGEEYCGECGVNLQFKGVGPIAGAPPDTSTHLIADQLAAGTYLSRKRYQIVRLVGVGGMGAVYQATDSHLGGNMVAIKEMNDAVLATEEEKKKASTAFEQEARLLSALSHSSLPRVTDYFSHENKRYLVMDLIEGKTLSELIAERTEPFPEEQVLLWAVQLCDVLDYLHTRTPPIIYRDLKPGNVIIAPDGKSLRLVDFGIARFYKPGAARDTISLGTQGFAPPEQYGKHQTDGRADLYALGAVMHYLLTLRDPASEPFKFPPVTAINPKVSSETNDVILCAVKTEVNQRWSSAAEMKAALQPASGSLLSYSTPPAAVGPYIPPPPAPSYTPPAPAYTPPAPAYIPPAPAYTPPVSSGGSNVFDLGKAAGGKKVSQPPPAAQLKRSGFLGYIFGILIFGVLMLVGMQYLVIQDGSFLGFTSLYIANFAFALTAMVFLKRPGALLLTGLTGLILASIFANMAMSWTSALVIYGIGELVFLLGWYRKFGFATIMLSAVLMVAAVVIFYTGMGLGITILAAQILAAGLIGLTAWLLGKIFRRI